VSAVDTNMLVIMPFFLQSIYLLSKCLLRAQLVSTTESVLTRKCWGQEEMQSVPALVSSQSFWETVPVA
jgi:hypothetical protein